MGLYDYVQCLYEIPVPNFATREWQSKSTEAQYMETYQIRRDGTLWHQKQKMSNCEEGWVHVPVTGEIAIYDAEYDGDYAVKFWFINGVVDSYIVIVDGYVVVVNRNEHHVVGVQDPDGNEVLYVDGRLVNTGDRVFFEDVVKAARGRPCSLSLVQISHVYLREVCGMTVINWPQTFDEIVPHIVESDDEHY